MLVLSRKKGETIVINNEIYITVVKNNDENTQIGIVAPKKMSVDRLEVSKQKEKTLISSKAISI